VVSQDLSQFFHLDQSWAVNVGMELVRASRSSIRSKKEATRRRITTGVAVRFRVIPPRSRFTVSSLLPDPPIRIPRGIHFPKIDCPNCSKIESYRPDRRSDGGTIHASHRTRSPV
jgi:hypothetical protein